MSYGLLGRRNWCDGIACRGVVDRRLSRHAICLPSRWKPIFYFCSDFYFRAYWIAAERRETPQNDVFGLNIEGKWQITLRVAAVHQVSVFLAHGRGEFFFGNRRPRCELKFAFLVFFLRSSCIFWRNLSETERPDPNPGYIQDTV